VDPLHDNAYFIQGKILWRQGRHEEAEKAWLDGLQQVPDSTLLAYRLGGMYLQQGRFAEAERIASRLKTFAPSDDHSQARLSMLLGRIEEAKGRLFEARRSYRMASTLVPGMPQYLTHVARVEGRMGNHAEAVRIYEQLVGQNFQKDEMERRLAKAREAQRGQVDDAMMEVLRNP
jgi:tetratricopeptide (TPR) repeat protein